MIRIFVVYVTALKEIGVLYSIIGLIKMLTFYFERDSEPCSYKHSYCVHKFLHENAITIMLDWLISAWT